MGHWLEDDFEKCGELGEGDSVSEERIEGGNGGPKGLGPVRFSPALTHLVRPHAAAQRPITLILST